MQDRIGPRPEPAGFIGIPRLAWVSASSVPPGKAWSFYRSLFVPQRNHPIDSLACLVSCSAQPMGL